jgi:cyclic beta-1,2-glucan synthetase
MSRPTRDVQPSLTAADELFLRRVARRTWRFFEVFVGPDDNHLPPDNYQEDPPQGTAHRTSPTNIGLALTANLAAYDFGYVPAGELLLRCARTMAAMERMQRHRGHFYNWYDTRTLDPLHPIYISTVDSGNLAGHLLTLAAGLHELSAAPIVHVALFRGLHDTLAVIAEQGAPAADLDRALSRMHEALAAPPRTLSGARALLLRLRTDAHALVRIAETQADGELLAWTGAFTAQLGHALADLLWIAPWLDLPALHAAHDLLARLDDPLTLHGAAALERTLVPLLDLAGPSADPDLRRAVLLGAGRAAACLQEAARLAARATELADIDYEFLYDRDRHLLAIGYNVGDHRLDASFYDLLASEARLASFVAIAQGKLPQEHWFRLGRSLTTTGGKPALLSWSGSMFEYLMPLLIMPTYRGSLLDETCLGGRPRPDRVRPRARGPLGRLRVGLQQDRRPAQLSVPGLRRAGPRLQARPRRRPGDRALRQRDGADGRAARRPATTCAGSRARAGSAPTASTRRSTTHPLACRRGSDSVTVASYMAHHQGMAFLALAYLLLDRPMQRRFAADPAFRATDLLLQERCPARPPSIRTPAEVSAAGDTGSPKPTCASSAPPTRRRRGAAALQRHLSRHGHQRRRRLQPLARPRGHPLARGPDARRLGQLLLPARRRDRQPSGRSRISRRSARVDPLRGHLLAGPRRVSPPRPRHRDPRRDQRLARGRRRAAPREPHQPRHDPADHRADQLRRGRARHARRRRRPPGVLQPVRPDRARARAQAILCSRRPRSGASCRLDAAPDDGARAPGAARRVVRDRARRVHRPRPLARRPAGDAPPTLGDSEGAVLDPVVAIRCTVVLESRRDRAIMHIVTGVAETRDGALALIDKYSDRHSADRVFELSWTHSQVLLRRLNASEADTQLYDRLASQVLYSSPSLRAPRSVLARNQRGQPSLWAYAISGDLPIVLVRSPIGQHLELVRQLVQAHAYWRLKGLVVDLVIWNEDPSGYRQAAARRDPRDSSHPSSSPTCSIDQVASSCAGRPDRRGGQGPAADGRAADHRRQRRHPRRAARPPSPRLVGAPPGFAGKPRRTRVADGPLRRSQPAPTSSCWNGRGGFTPDGREYVITTTRGPRRRRRGSTCWPIPLRHRRQRERGAYTWCENAHELSVSRPGTTTR